VSPTIYHEYLHSIVETNSPWLPLWLDEGLAEFYASFDVEDGYARIGYPIGEHLAWLHEHALIPIEELIAVDHDSPLYNEGIRRGSFYAQSWALTHMLIVEHPGGQAKIARYSALLRNGVDHEEAFLTAFETTCEDLEKELNGYIRNRRFGYAKVPVTETAKRASNASEISDPEVLTRLGDLLAGLGADRYEQAGEHYRAALIHDPSYAPALAGLGFLDELAGRDGEALARYRAAAELTDDDFMIEYLLGSRLCVEASRAESADTQDGLYLEARKVLRRSVELNPRFGEAWAMLGRTYFAESDSVDPGIGALENAHRLLPKREDVGYNLTALYLNAGRIGNARVVVDRMRTAGVDASTVLAAESLILTAESARAAPTRTAGTTASEAEPTPGPDRTPGFTEGYNRAVDLVNDDDLEAAAAALEKLLETDLTEREAQSADELLSQVRAFSSFSSKADEAMRLVDAGEIDAAIAILEPLLADAPDQARTTEIRRMLDKLYGYRDFQSAYNRAVDQFNAGEYDEAAALLAPLVDRAPSPQLSQMAAALLEEIDEAR
jgi:tetratricopeptide (TPR) repeat protein